MTQRTLKVLIASAGLLAFVACGSGDSDDAVDIRLVAYQPEALTVAPGTEVTWTQHDAGSHTVTSGTTSIEDSGAIDTRPDGTFRSGQLATDETFAHTFSEPGSFRYFCEIHPATMRGRIDVQ